MKETVDIGGVCVVTFRSRESSQNATRELLDILSAFTTVSLVTAGLTPDSVIRERYEVVDVSGKGTGFGPLTMAVRFAVNQARLCRALAARDERVVLFFGATAYVIPVLFARLLGKVVVVEPRGDVPLTLEIRWRESLPLPVARTLAAAVRILERITFWVASAIITYTPSMAASLDLSPHSRKLHTRGARHVDVQRFRPDVPFENREPRIGFVGRLDAEKGVHLLSEVADQLAGEVNFAFVGDGHYRDSLEERLAEHIEKGGVEVTGWVPHEDVADHLNRLTILVMPSAPTEGLPSAILEAFACGTIVYTTPVAGIPDVVEDGVTGFVMHEETPEAMAERIRDILNRDDLIEVSERARSLVEERYSYEATVERYREMFREIG